MPERGCGRARRTGLVVVDMQNRIAADARRLGYHVTVPLHATVFVGAHPAGDQAAVTDLRAAGITVTR